MWQIYRIEEAGWRWWSSNKEAGWWWWSPKEEVGDGDDPKRRAGWWSPKEETGWWWCSSKEEQEWWSPKEKARWWSPKILSGPIQTVIMDHHGLGDHQHQNAVSNSSGDCQVQTQGAYRFGVLRPCLLVHLPSLSSCVSKGALWGCLYMGMNPTHEGFTFMTESCSWSPASLHQWTGETSFQYMDFRVQHKLHSRYAGPNPWNPWMCSPTR